MEETARGDLSNERRVARELARQAGAAALQFYGKPLHVARKGEINEPVTEADYAANEVIVSGLRAEFPQDGMLSEELSDDGARLNRARLWIVDPLDGTKGFIAGDGDFAVQIGLAIAGEPALGVVYLPATDVLYWAVRGEGAWVERAGASAERLSVSDESDLHRARLAVSRSHRSPRMSRVVGSLGVCDEIARGSVGVKVSLIVERQCDLYIHLSAFTKQWDTCAPDAILREAGGALTDLWGAPVRYNTSDVQNHNGLLASNRALHAQTVAALAPLLEEFGRKRFEA